MSSSKNTNLYFHGVRDRLFFSQFRGFLKDGSINSDSYVAKDDAYGLDDGQYYIEGDKCIISFTVRLHKDNMYACSTLPRLNRGILNKAQDMGFAESERLAKAYARSFHLEEYAFSHFEKPGRLKAKRPVYTLFRVRELVAISDVSSWQLEPGGEISLPGLTDVPALGNRWDEEVKKVEAAAATFHQLSSRFPENIYDTELEPARANVATLLAEAKEAAAVGLHLESILEPTNDILQTREKAFSLLEERRENILVQVHLISELRLQIRNTFPLPLQAANSSALQSLVSASADIARVLEAN